MGLENLGTISGVSGVQIKHKKGGAQCMTCKQCHASQLTPRGGLPASRQGLDKHCVPAGDTTPWPQAAQLVAARSGFLGDHFIWGTVRTDGSVALRAS